MTTPKEALAPLAKATEAFGALSNRRDTEEIWLWRRFSNIEDQDYGITLQDALNAKAAIPVAELHEEMVDLMKESPVTVEETGEWIDKRDTLLTKLEALKCTPQK